MADNEDIGIPAPEKSLPSLDSEEESLLEPDDKSPPALEDHIDDFEKSSEEKEVVKEEISNIEPPKESLETPETKPIETKLEQEPKKGFFQNFKEKFGNKKTELPTPEPVKQEIPEIKEEPAEIKEEPPPKEVETSKETELPPEVDGKKVSDIIEKVKDKEDEIRKRENLLIIKREELKHKSLDLRGMESEINDRLTKLEDLEKQIRGKEGELAYKEELIAEKEKQILEIEDYVKKLQEKRIRQDVFIEKTAKKLDENSLFKNFLHEKILPKEEIPSSDMEFDNFSDRLDKIQIFNLVDYAYSLLREGNYSEARKVYSRLRLKFKNSRLDSVEKAQALTAIKSLYFDLKSYSEGLVSSQ